YYKDIKIPYEITREDMMVTAGASEGMVIATAMVTDPGDDILVFEPFYAPYLTYAHFMNVNLIPVALTSENNFHLPSKEEIVKKITPKTKAIFFTNPNNPTGTVFTKEEMQLILDIAREYHLFVVSDETYRGMVFDKKESLSLLHITTENTVNNVIVVDSLSKRLNVCGARMGLVMSKNRDLMSAASRFAMGIPYAAYLDQEIVAPMLADCLDYVQWLSNEYQNRRDVFIKTLSDVLQTSIHQPEGAFYVMLALPIDDASTFAKWMLTDFEQDKETVMVSPGAGFYATPEKGKNEVRIAYILNEDDLKKAATLLAEGVKQYNKTHK
ncbi:MAG: aminotransferase class I/II-fold pyridoxal phosphate-dependent enzyme, partial [Candidatus Levybacteria bacterium]|nr:aminotransferase class I/II-fold pyridoxal phosphate-dependent enzyme [Candidatus Levybacteria bacterium]